MQIINSSARRIGWAIKTTNMKRLGVDPPCGVLDPKESTLMAVSCDAFAYGQEVREIGNFSNTASGYNNNGQVPYFDAEFDESELKK